jgi:hypothetical protein
MGRDRGTALQRLLDRSEIEDVLARYARAVDHGTWDDLWQVYHRDAYDDHVKYRGDVPGLIAWLTERFAAADNSTHVLGNRLMSSPLPTSRSSRRTSSACACAHRPRTSAPVWARMTRSPGTRGGGISIASSAATATGGSRTAVSSWRPASRRSAATGSGTTGRSGMAMPVDAGAMAG